MCHKDNSFFLHTRNAISKIFFMSYNVIILENIHHPPRIPQLCGQFVLLRILIEEVFVFGVLYLIVLNMELDCYVNICANLLKCESKRASTPVKINYHEIRQPNSNSKSNHNRKPMEKQEENDDIIYKITSAKS